MQEILITSIYGIRRDIDARKCCILSHRILGQSFVSIQTEHPRVHSWFKASANRDKMIRILSVTWRLGRSSEDEPICVGLWVSCTIEKHNVDSKICLPRGSQSLKEPVWKCLTVPDRIRIRKCWLLRPGKKIPFWSEKESQTQRHHRGQARQICECQAKTQSERFYFTWWEFKKLPIRR